MLPRPGEWRVEVEAKDPPILRKLRKVKVEQGLVDGFAEVDLRLGAGRLSGRVVDPKRVPMVNAIVEIQSDDQWIQAVSDTEGRFEQWGLEPGSYHVAAKAETDLQSDTVAVDVAEDLEGPEVELVVRKVVYLKGAVSSETTVVPGARVEAKIVRPFSLHSTGTTSDAQGLFKLMLPAESRQVVLTVAAPGFAFRMVRLPINDRQIGVRVETLGGTLVLDFEEPPWSDDGIGPYVFHNDAYSGLFPLVQWGRFTDGEVDNHLERTHFVFPMLSPGDYGVCILSAQEALSVGNSWRALKHCASGYLPPNGELKLVVPSRPPR